MHEFDVIMIEDDTDRYVSLVPVLLGLQHSRRLLRRTMSNTKEAINLHLESLDKERKKIFFNKKLLEYRK